MRIVPNGRQIDAHLLGDSKQFDNTKSGFSEALKWASDVIGALLLTFFLIIALSAAERF
ncbi:hypothetical protein I2492_19470 [Budviciaceae bacterium CWB-B4]|uniref:Uncharacterized protein n=1 Tax=Limnobaculum xujianqingii TaxID=2738837 RepID=A0A9D7G0G7_9GAMM|nr:hypothetical protein [Limnobaculum xujianqingii]MBK5075181.1 hypothetical protein [Limnobaculum xujianqingii]MBK5178491.1 hypothetical protein [Limnobaculum xujianqingii]